MKASKKPKIHNIAAGKHVSLRAKSAIIKQIRDEGLPDAISESTQARERAAVANPHTEYGPVLVERDLEMTNGGTMSVAFQHPVAMLSATLERSATFRELFTRIIERDQRRLRIVIYNDEVTPGLTLARRNDRKSHGIYWSFLNFGFPLLAQECMWFTATTVRSTYEKLILGGVALLYKIFLLLFFGQPTGPDFSRGIFFTLGDHGRPLVFAEVAMSIADERAHKATLKCAGASGTHCCWLCKNILMLRSRRLPDPTGYCRPCDELDIQKIDFHTDESIRAVLTKLKEIAEAGDGDRLARMEEELGWNHLEGSWLLDPRLGVRVVHISAVDWMHCMNEGGAYEKELEALIPELDGYGYGFQTFDSFFKLWQWPKGYANPRRVFEDKKWSGNASECISVAELFIFFLLSLPHFSPQLALKINSMILCARLLLLLNRVQSGNVSWQELHRATMLYLRSHHEAWGDAIWVPKFHYLIHLARMLRIHKILVSTFVHERKHKAIKQSLTGRYNNVGRDRSVLEDITAQQFHELEQSLDFVDRIVNPVAAPRNIVNVINGAGFICQAEDVQTSSNIYVKSRKVCKGDVVVYTDALGNTSVGLVVFHAAVAGTTWSCLQNWPVESTMTDAMKCKVTEDAPELVLSSNIIRSCCFSLAGSGATSTVLWDGL